MIWLFRVRGSLVLRITFLTMLLPTKKTLFVALVVFLLGRDIWCQWPPHFIVIVLLDR